MNAKAEKVRARVDADLTAKARIRNAALDLFASKGEASTSLREIAEAAGVTHGLVVHHFGSKDGLRRAVQEYVTSLIQAALEATPRTGSPAELGRARDAAVLNTYAEYPMLLRYIRRAMLDLDRIDPEFFKQLADLTLKQVRDLRASGTARSSVPEHHQAFAILIRELGLRILAPVADSLWRCLGEETGAPAPQFDIKVKAPDY